MIDIADAPLVPPYLLDRIPMLGIVLAILCAVIWSFAVILFKKSGDGQHPVLLNSFKNFLGFFLLLPTVAFIEGPQLPVVSVRDGALLLFSGLLGIGIADAMVLRALAGLGASVMAIVECAYSPFVILFSVLFLGETLSITKVIGTVLVLSAIIVVSITRSNGRLVGPSPRARATSVAWGIGGLFAMAVGIVAVKPIFGHVPLLWIITIRLGAGCVASGVLVAMLRDRRALWQRLWGSEHRGLILAASFLSTYLAMICWVAGYQYNDAAVTAVLNQTSTIFTVIFATVLLKEPFGRAKATGAALAFGGVLCMTLG